MTDIQTALFALRDPAYQAFQSKLIPSIAPPDGDRRPGCRLCGSWPGNRRKRPVAGGFLQELPHRYYEENNLHGLLISAIPDYDGAVAALETFLPYVDNWATCDLLSPKAFRKHPPELRKQIRRWWRMRTPILVRFGLGMLMNFYLDEGFQMEDLDLAAGVRREEYYVKMMAAWYFATALAKQYDAALPYLRQRRLDRWTHNKTIQKAVESYRITARSRRTSFAACAGRTAQRRRGYEGLELRALSLPVSGHCLLQRISGPADPATSTGWEQTPISNWSSLRPCPLPRRRRRRRRQSRPGRRWTSRPWRR